MKTSETINELAAALATAQGEMENAVMDAANPHFRSKYATLASIRNATIPALAKNGLALIQATELTTAEMLLTTRLVHASGQWLESVYPIPIVDKPHIMGSALTYARRYSWAALIGIAAEEDDDGNEAQNAAKNGQPVPMKRTREQISAEANRKRQETRDVKQDIDQIDSLPKLDRYAREVLTPELMAGLGSKQWAVEQWIGEKRRELEATPEEEEEVYQRATAEQITKFREIQEYLDGAQDRADLKHRAGNAGYLEGIKLLTPHQKQTLRDWYAVRMETIPATAP